LPAGEYFVATLKCSRAQPGGRRLGVTSALKPHSRRGIRLALADAMTTMKAVVFKGKDQIALEEVPRPSPRAGEAVIRITTTTICGTDVHIVRGEYPVRPGLIIGHEPVGVIDELGPGLEDTYEVGQRVIAGAITPCGQCYSCLNGSHSQCGTALGGWRFGNTIDGAWAEYLLVPDARANLAIIPEALTDEQVVLCPDIFSTGLSGAESGNIRVGDSVAVFAQGPIGLCATLGARLRGASTIVAIDTNDHRLAIARRFGASVTLNPSTCDVVAEIKRLTDGRGADVTIEALGRQETFEGALRATRPGGTLSSLGVYSGKLSVPYDAFYAGLADQKIVTTLCPGGKERMRRLMAMISSGRVDLQPLVTHHFSLDQIAEAYDLFSHQRDNVLKVALHPAR
jgi:alcohol dehydrogenase